MHTEKIPSSEFHQFKATFPQFLLPGMLVKEIAESNPL